MLSGPNAFVLEMWARMQWGPNAISPYIGGPNAVCPNALVLIVLGPYAIRAKCIHTLYDRFFDGILQRDALECFLKFSEFLHSGTKACLIDCEDGSLIDDDFVTSLTKILFTSTLKKSLICSVCQFNNESDVHTQLVNVYPENKKHPHRNTSL